MSGITLVILDAKDPFVKYGEVVYRANFVVVLINVLNRTVLTKFGPSTSLSIQFSARYIFSKFSDLQVLYIKSSERYMVAKLNTAQS